MPSTAGIVIPETVYGMIPERVIGLNQYALAERNPDVIHDQRPKPEVLYPQGGRSLLYGFSMLFKPVFQGVTLCGIKFRYAGSGSRWLRLADVNRVRECAALVSLHDLGVRLECAGVVDGVDAGTVQIAYAGERLYVSGE